MDELTSATLSLSRVIGGFIVAPLIAALTLAWLRPLYAGLPDLSDRILQTTLVYAVFGAYPITLFLGIPAYRFFRTRIRATALNCAVIGAAIAALPWLVIGLLSRPDYASINGNVTHQNGMITWRGLLELLFAVGEIGALGAVSGVIFWCIAGGYKLKSVTTEHGS